MVSALGCFLQVLFISVIHQQRRPPHSPIQPHSQHQPASNQHRTSIDRHRPASTSINQPPRTPQQQAQTQNKLLPALNAFFCHPRGNIKAPPITTHHHHHHHHYFLLHFLLSLTSNPHPDTANAHNDLPLIHNPHRNHTACIRQAAQEDVVVRVVAENWEDDWGVMDAEVSPVGVETTSSTSPRMPDLRQRQRDRMSPRRPFAKAFQTNAASGRDAGTLKTPSSRTTEYWRKRQVQDGVQHDDHALRNKKSEAEDGKFNITPDGGSAGREGRQFTVSKVGNNGRIYLRYVEVLGVTSPHHARILPGMKYILMTLRQPNHSSREPTIPSTCFHFPQHSPEYGWVGDVCATISQPARSRWHLDSPLTSNPKRVSPGSIAGCLDRLNAKTET